MSNNNCKLCAKPIDLEEYIPHLPIPKLMAEHQLCFSCAFWTKKLAEDRVQNEIAKTSKPYIGDGKPEYFIPLVIDGEHRSISSKKAYGGNTIAILTIEGNVYTPTQVYYQGIIPPHFRDKFPNNAITLDKIDLTEIKSLSSSQGLGLAHITVPQNVVQKMFDKFYKSK